MKSKVPMINEWMVLIMLIVLPLVSLLLGVVPLIKVEKACVVSSDRVLFASQLMSVFRWL